jgi:urate oxidase
MAQLQFNAYGKTGIRLVHVDRSNARHQLRQLDVKIFFEGDFAETYITGNNSDVLPTDTMKNTVYALARSSEWDSIEKFGQTLAQHFLARVGHLSKVRVEIVQTPWARIGEHNAAFLLGSLEKRITEVVATRLSCCITSGIKDLQILKTGKSAFEGFLRDEFTTLAPAADRLFGTVLEAGWTYGSDVSFNETFAKIRSELLDCFAGHNSLSVQQTLFAMAQAVLDSTPEVTELKLTMPNRHCLLVDLSKFGLDNPNEVFVPTDAPSGHIEARVTR